MWPTVNLNLIFFEQILYLLVEALLSVPLDFASHSVSLYIHNFIPYIYIYVQGLDVYGFNDF